MASPKAPRVPFVVSFGAEDYFLDRDLESARVWGRSVVLVDGDGLTDTELVGICETRTMEDTLRVVIVDDAHKVKGDKALKRYIEDKSPKNDSTILVAIARSEKCPAIWVQAAKKGKLIEHRKLKTWDNNNEVVKWVDFEAERLGVRLDSGVASAFFTLLGNDLYRIAGELRKLALLVGSEKATLQHLKLIISPSLVAKPYEVADAAADKNPKKALNLLSTVYRNMGDKADIPITNALMWKVERLAVVRSMLDRGVAETDIAVAIEMHPYKFANSLLPQARRHQLVDLVRVMGRLCQLDANVKGPARSKRTHVELAVLSITG